MTGSGDVLARSSRLIIMCEKQSVLISAEEGPGLDAGLLELSLMRCHGKLGGNGGFATIGAVNRVRYGKVKAF